EVEQRGGAALRVGEVERLLRVLQKDVRAGAGLVEVEEAEVEKRRAVIDGRRQAVSGGKAEVAGIAGEEDGDARDQQGARQAIHNGVEQGAQVGLGTEAASKFD